MTTGNATGIRLSYRCHSAVEGRAVKASRSTIASAIDLVTCLFAAFGDFLTQFAPPMDASPGIAVGLGSMLTLVVALFISGLAQDLPNRKYRRYWLLAALVLLVTTVVTSARYTSSWRKLTFNRVEGDSNRWYRGLELTPDARKWLTEDKHKGMTDEDCVRDKGGWEERKKVWTSESLNETAARLCWQYIAMVLSFAATVFCLTEGLLRERPRRPGKARAGITSGKREKWTGG